MKSRNPQTTLAWSLMLASLLSLVPALTRAETAVEAWVQRYSNPDIGSDDWANNVACDSAGNIIVAGGSSDRISADYMLIIKYSSLGVPLWTNRYDGGPAGTLVVDSGNNVIVAGYSATIKYSTAGVPLWTNLHPSGGYGQLASVAVDGSNNVIVTGISSSTNGGSDCLTVKYSGDGIPLWTNRYHESGNSSSASASALAVDGSNNVVVTGTSYTSGSGSYVDYLTIKYSSEGVPLWTNRYDGPANNNDDARAVAVDSGNNVIVTGSSDSDYMTIKYSGAGVPLWTNRYSGGGSARALAVDNGNNVIVTGISYGGGSSGDYATIKYSSAGVPLWTNRYNGPANGNEDIFIPDPASEIRVGKACLAVGPDGAVVVTGASDGDYGGGDTYDFATVKYVSSPDITRLSFDTSPGGLHWTNSGFALTVRDLLGRGPVLIHVSTNLINWELLWSNSPVTGTLQFIDTQATNGVDPAHIIQELPYSEGRFYRASEQW